MKLVCLPVALVSIIGLVFALQFILSDSVSAQSQNMTPNMVINMSDLSIKVGNTTSNETITFSNNTNNTSTESENTTR
jgi:hypothetical protein